MVLRRLAAPTIWRRAPRGARIDPQATARAALALLAVLVGLTAWQVARQGLPPAPPRTRGAAVLGVTLLAQAPLLPLAGFVPVTTILFAVTARLLGSARPARDARRRPRPRSAAVRRLHLGARGVAAGRRVDGRPARRGAAVVSAASLLLDGFAVALSPANLGWGLAGATLGTAVGVLPGIGPALTVALLLPVTYSLDPTAALIMFAGIYYGAMYGGSTTSILLNTPGESATMVTALEGHQMARAGRGGAALATSAIGSFVAGTLATFALSVAAPLMVPARARLRARRVLRARRCSRS